MKQTNSLLNGEKSLKKVTISSHRSAGRLLLESDKPTKFEIPVPFGIADGSVATNSWSLTVRETLTYSNLESDCRKIFNSISWFGNFRSGKSSCQMARTIMPLNNFQMYYIVCRVHRLCRTQCHTHDTQQPSSVNFPFLLPF